MILMIDNLNRYHGYKYRSLVDYRLGTLQINNHKSTNMITFVNLCLIINLIRYILSKSGHSILLYLIIHGLFFKIHFSMKPK